MVSSDLACWVCCGRNPLKGTCHECAECRVVAVRAAGVRGGVVMRALPYSEAERETILRAYQERSSLRGLSRTFGVSRNTVTAWLKKKP